MAQTTDFEIANSSGLVFRGRVNEVLAALQSSNSGATAPTDTAAGMLWFDTSVTPAILRRRNAADTAWLAVYSEEDLASQAQAEAGSDNTKLMTPLRTAQAITAQVSTIESMTLLGTLTTTSGTTQTLSGLTLTGYKQIVCVVNSVSFGNTSRRLALDGKALSVTNSALSDVYAGIITFSLVNGICNSLVSVETVADLNAGSPITDVYVAKLSYTTASTSISFSALSSSSTFTAGSILVYGVK